MAHKHVAGEGGRSTPDSRRSRLITWLIVVPSALLTLAGLIALWPTEDVRPESTGAVADIGGKVLTITRTECPPETIEAVNGCGTAEVDLDGEGVVGVDLPTGIGSPLVSEGDDVLLIEGGSVEGPGYTIIDHQRSTGLWILSVAFAAALIAFGRWKGLSALAGLAVTFVVLFWFIIPAILGGGSPLLVAIVGSAAIMLVVLYLTHGFNLTTTVAVVGTTASFVLTGLLSWFAVKSLHLTGVTDDLSFTVGSQYEVDPAGLLLAGIVIGSLGVLDDVTVTQAATVRELTDANPDYTARDLYRSASRVGRSHIASVVNTIVLAYAGASLPVMILTFAESTSVSSILTSQFITQEIVRSATATLGLIAAVPITTALGAVVLGAARRQQTPAGS